MNHRWGHDNFGRGKSRRVTADAGWKQPLAWARAAAKTSKRMLVSPLDCDPLDPEVHDHPVGPLSLVAGGATFDRFMDLIHATGEVAVDAMTGKLVTGCCETQVVGGITWLLLTKRPENWRWIPKHVRPFCWLIYSASDQPSLDAGIGELLDAQGFAGLGLSLEPLVGPVDCARSVRMSTDTMAEPLTGIYHITHEPVPGEHDGGIESVPGGPRVSWIIIGGESGPKARPCNVEWIRSLVRQCREAGVSPHVKQLGARASDPVNGLAGPLLDVPADAAALISRRLHHKSGADPAEWPEAFPQEWPEGLR